MSLDDFMAWLAAASGAWALFAVGCLIDRGVRWISAWRLRRRMRNLPAPDDPRLRNEISLRDWKDRERAATRLRSAA